MNISADASTPLDISPRNLWARFKTALVQAERGCLYQAYQTLEQVRYHPNLSPAILELYTRQIEQFATRSDRYPLINTPADYLKQSTLGFRHPFRRIHAETKTPSPYPPSMALPPLVGTQNDYSFLRDAAAIMAPSVKNRLQTTHIIISAAHIENLPTILTELARQTYQGQIILNVFGDLAPDLQIPARFELRTVLAPILSVEGVIHLREIVEENDDLLIMFLDGELSLDPAALDRAAHYARVTDSLIQPLVTGKPEATLQTPFSDPMHPGLFSNAYPFRDMQGMNFVAPSGLLRRAGLPDTRFGSHYLASRELAFRMFVKGAYFAPLAVPLVTPPRDDKDPANANDTNLYINLCPNHWDRKTDGVYERPRVSVYIPAYNAARYIRRAVDSVLDQDFQDLEVSICNDGSGDETAQILETHYGDNPKVRWTNRRNGGIGCASNVAIHHSFGPYIGQLDSDDVLKPGAVRRMVEYLDENPKTACVYGSQERIDAEGNYIKDEYRWPVFSREKMMITSIAHHFRMFRRSCWERTDKFREDIVNGIDYDIFLKLSETGPMHHIDEIMYQRRWHGENTSMVNESHQTANTHRVQNETLKRLGLARFWDVHVPDPKEPRRVTYRRNAETQTVLFWPDYSRSNPYQQMLYGGARKTTEICAGDIDAALELIGEFEDPSKLTFHLHWLNFLFLDVTDAEEAKIRAEAFLEKLAKFIWKGGRVVWTIHNHVSHDTPFHDTEVWLSGEIAKQAHVLHFHAEGSVDEVAEVFEIPREKVVVIPHGHYIGAYPDFVSRETARETLGIDPSDEVILFTGQVRPYKGVEQLIAAFRALLKERPRLRLLIVGEMKHDLFAAVQPKLTKTEEARITATNRFVGDMELQLFLRAADVAVYPYAKILTSGSLMLALSFDLPVIVPEVAMTRDVSNATGRVTLMKGDQTSDQLKGQLQNILSEEDAVTRVGHSTSEDKDFAHVFSWSDVSSLLRAERK